MTSNFLKEFSNLLFIQWSNFLFGHFGKNAGITGIIVYHPIQNSLLKRLVEYPMNILDRFGTCRLLSIGRCTESVVEALNVVRHQIR